MTDTSHPGITPDDTGTVPDFDIASGRVGTERKRAEEALREAQMALAHTNRVATLGQLAASTRMIAAPVEHLDPARVIKISQADTGEIVLETLIDGLLRAAMEHAGVERCLLIGQRDGELEIQAEATMRREDVTVHLRDEGRIRRLVDSNIIGIIFVWDLEGRIIEANDAFLYMVGYDREDLVSGRVRWTDLTPAEWRERDEHALAELSSTGTVQPYEKEYFRKDGSRVPVLIGCALSEESRNEGIAFVLDLTERKRADEALRESEAKFRDYAETASDWFWEIGPDYKFTLLTENAFGSDPARRIGTACWEHALDLETEPEKWRVVRETLDARRPFREFVYRSRQR